MGGGDICGIVHAQGGISGGTSAAPDAESCLADGYHRHALGSSIQVFLPHHRMPWPRQRQRSPALGQLIQVAEMSSCFPHPDARRRIRQWRKTRSRPDGRRSWWLNRGWHQYRRVAIQARPYRHATSFRRHLGLAQRRQLRCLPDRCGSAPSITGNCRGNSTGLAYVCFGPGAATSSFCGIRASMGVDFDAFKRQQRGASGACHLRMGLATSAERCRGIILSLQGKHIGQRKKRLLGQGRVWCRPLISARDIAQP